MTLKQHHIVTLVKRRNTGGFTLLEAVVMVIIITALIGLVLLILDRKDRRPLGRMWIENSSRLRGIHQNLVVYALGNNNHYPGIDAQGEPTDLTVAGRFQILLGNEYFTADYIIAPGEQLTPWNEGDTLTAANYSYAMLEISTPGERQAEWRDTAHSDAVVLSDRNVGTDGKPENVQSIWTETPGEWRGGVARNDNSVGWETSPILERTQYAGGGTLWNDNIYIPGSAVDEDGTPSDPGDDAHLIHDGE
jgi:hypothetical protein